MASQKAKEIKLRTENKIIQRTQELMNEEYYQTGDNGIPDPVRMLTKAVNNKIKAEKKEIELKHKKCENWGVEPDECSPPKNDADTHVSTDCKGSLGLAYNAKQPWNYKMEMVNERIHPAPNINLIDNLPKIKERKRILENFTQQQSPERFLENKEQKGLELDSRNKIQNIFKTERYSSNRPPPIKSASPKPLSSFRNFYQMQNEKLELQKQHLLKLQSIQKEQRKLRYKQDVQQIDIQSFKDQFDSIKQQNQSAIQAIDTKQKEYDNLNTSPSLDTMSLSHNPFVLPG